MPYQPAEAVVSARLRGILAKSSICLNSLAQLSKPYRGAAAVPRGFTARRPATLPQSGPGKRGPPGGSGAGSPLDGDLPLPPRPLPPARGAAASWQQVWKPLAALRLLHCAVGESLVIPQHASAKDESVFCALVFGLPSNVKSGRRTRAVLPFIASRRGAARGVRPLSWGRSGNWVFCFHRRAVEVCAREGAGTAGGGGGDIWVLNHFT